MVPFIIKWGFFFIKNAPVSRGDLNAHEKYKKLKAA